MLQIATPAQQEVSQLFAVVSSMTREQLVESPLLTKLESGTGDVYTLRTRSARVFCTFDPSDDLLFLDVTEVKFPSIETSTPQEGEITLFGSKGDPKAYVANDV